LAEIAWRPRIGGTFSEFVTCGRRTTGAAATGEGKADLHRTDIHWGAGR
jgi:hypothetical protein